MKEFLFDTRMFASIRVGAADEQSARLLLANVLDRASCNLGVWPDGSPIACQISIEGTPELVLDTGAAPAFGGSSPLRATEKQ